MRIQEIADKSNLPQDTIRYWERLGLLRPTRSDNGYRDFNAQDYRRIALIQLAKEAGFTLAEIATLLDPIMKDGFTFGDLSGILKAQREHIDDKIKALTGIRERITHILDSCPRRGVLVDSVFDEARS